MTSIEKPLQGHLDMAWALHHDYKPILAFEQLFKAVKLLADLAIAQEARSLSATLPHNASEAPAGPNVPPDWESRCKGQAEAIKSALNILAKLIVEENL